MRAPLVKRLNALEEKIAALQERPSLKYAGVWTEGAYPEGTAVTHGGSIWVSRRATEAKPSVDSADWQLAVRRGRDGKDSR